ncbi:hypothetical protein QR680_015775 [Steinernema hermaphroditum]|uniref:Uncharacterized protein n=1 Tax=Steinernema hermaphroditum TaxID=289476 RepID=A0AA39H8X1_9BILA|nr:hypothetical protein QR680_015775 [Steinernema hermaphroditum]
MFAAGRRSTATLCTFFFVLFLTAPVFGDDKSDESHEARKRRESSTDLTDVKDNDGDNAIIGAMFNISKQLSGEEAVEWDLLMEECNSTSYNSSLTSDEMIVFIAAEIKTFFMKFPDVREKFLYLQIGGWGDFEGLFQVAIWINADFAESVIVVSGGQCELEIAIERYIETVSDQNEKIALEELVPDISYCVNDESLSYEEKMANISTTFAAFFKQHASWKQAIMSIEIEEFGPISSFLDVADMYFRIANFYQLFMVESGETDCRLVVDMTAEVNNAKYKFSRSEKAMLLDFIDNIRVLIAKNASLSVEAKVKAVVYQYSQLMKIGAFLKFRLREFAIGVSFGFGTFGDLIDAYDFGVRFLPTGGPTTMSATTPAQGDCSTVDSVIQVFSGNMTIFYQDTDIYLKKNHGNQAINWHPYLNMCQHRIIMNSTVPSTEKIQKIAFTIKTYIGQNSACADYLYAIQLGNWGTYKELQTCGGH